MSEVRRIARTAAKLQYLAEQYREQARRDASKRASLEGDAAALDRFAASLLALVSGETGVSRAA